MNKILFILLGVALILRLPGLSSSFWLDEAAQALESVRPWQQQLQIVDDFQPPLLHLLIHAVQYVNHSEWWLRLWGALLPGLATIALTYQIGKRARSTKLGIIAAVLLTSSSLHVFYSQELRPYALPAFFATLTWYFLLEKQELSNKKKILFVLATAAGLFSTYLYPFVLLGQAAFAVFASSKSRYQFALLLAAGVLLFLPWLPSFMDQLEAGQKLRADLPGWEMVVSTPQLKALPLTFGKFLYGVVDLEVTPVFAIAPVLIIATLMFNFVYLRSSNPKLDRRFMWALFCWVGMSIITAWLVSFVVPVLQPKRVLFALPGFYLLLGYWYVIFLDGTNKTKKWASSIGIATLFLCNILGLFQYYTNPLLQREDWRGLISRIEQEYPREQSVAVFAFPAAFAPFVWYGNGYPSVSTGVLSTEDSVNLTQTLAPIQQSESVLIFDYLRDLTDPKNRVVTTVEEFGYTEKTQLDTPNIGFVRVYARY